ncbi:MAG: ParB/RepB/Spo0J family partition protein, partial [Patescibacteria group bacterium]|nr:ParB/RepB/Spo0J family partition protein [Patescibacteria group bacterium]
MFFVKNCVNKYNGYFFITSINAIGVIMETAAKVVPIHPKTEKKVLSVLVASIRRYVDQPRTEFDDDALRALADSIVEHGLQQPVTVVALEDCRHDFELKDGERRWRAHQLANLEYIEVIVDYKTKSGEQHLQSLISNFNRKDHTPMEISNAFVKERASGTTVDSLAKACGKSTTWVYQHLSLQNLHHKLQKL